MNRLAGRLMVAVAGMAVLGMTATLAGATAISSTVRDVVSHRELRPTSADSPFGLPSLRGGSLRAGYTCRLLRSMSLKLRGRSVSNPMAPTKEFAPHPYRVPFSENHRSNHKSVRKV